MWAVLQPLTVAKKLDSISMAAESDSKYFLALLNGVAKRMYYGEHEISDELLKNEIYPNMSDEEFHTLLNKVTGMIKSMAKSDMDFNQLDAFLTSYTKKREGGITEAQAEIFKKFWKNHKNRIHNSLVARCCWNPTLKGTSWRLDLQTNASKDGASDAPVVIMELQLKNSLTSKEESVVFEVNEKRLTMMLDSLKEVEKCIAKYDIK